MYGRQANLGGVILNKKRVGIILMIFSIISISAVCFAYSKRNYINEDVSAEHKTLIEDRFSISLPDKGKVNIYKNSNIGRIVEVYCNESDYEMLREQLVESAFSEPSEYSGCISKNYGVNVDDIEEEIWINAPEPSHECYCWPVYKVFISKIENDVFRVLFEY